ncbi:MAG: hypothetical protein JNL08_17860 [Planctomycetes bacterium]|nr:hypothetical protein [Planctomycetota bacterium]
MTFARRLARWLGTVALGCAVVVAQDAAPLLAREQQLKQRAVAGLNEAADAMAAQQQHRRALELRREVLIEYDTDDPVARERCGFVAAAGGWQRDERKLVLDRDLSGDKRAVKKVEQKLDALGRDLLKEHRALAEAFAKLPDPDRAAHHWRRVLRWSPDDRTALAALAQSTFEGFRGDARQMALLRRARTIRGAVDWLLRTPFQVDVVAGATHPLLTAAGLQHTGVRSRHFQVFGTLPSAQMAEIAQFAERALWLTHTLFGTSDGDVFRPIKHRDFLFVATSEAYNAVLDHCKTQFDADRLAFLKSEMIDQAFVEDRGVLWRLYRATKGRDIDLDQTVRAVVQDASGIDTDGLYEGIGHAACGFLFGRTMTFLLEQKKERTSASAAESLLSPDFATWRQIAEQSAWSRTDSRTSELVLLSAARFSNEQRVKAWAIGDYLLHWRPEWLRELDRCRGNAVRTPPEVEAEFQRRTAYELPRIDSEWRDFWVRERELRDAMAKDPIAGDKGPDPARQRARSLVDAVNAERVAAGRGPVGFYTADNGETRAVRSWSAELAKAEARRKKKPSEDVPLPVPPAALGTTVAWSRAKEATAAVAAWLAVPSLRDALLHPGRGLCGAALGDEWLLDLGELAQPTRTGLPTVWPAADQTGVPGDVAVSGLDARAQSAVVAAGRAVTDRVGMPLTLHFAREVPRATLAAVRCRVFDGNLPIDGALAVYAADDTAHERCDGLVAFVPLQPLPSGHRLEVRWELPAELLPPETGFPAALFTVR